MSDALAAAHAAIVRQEWQAALDATERVEEDTPERAEVRADALWWLGRLDECIEQRERAYRLYDEAGDHRRAGLAATWLFEHHGMGLRPAISSAWLRRARRALEDDGDSPERGALLLREVEAAHQSGELDRAAQIADEVIVLGRRLRAPDLEAEALQAKGRVLIDRGDIVDGIGHLDEAMLFAIEGRLRPYSTGKVYCSLITACEELGDLDRAAEWTDATLQWASAHPFAIFPGICRVHRAVVLKRRGSFADAEREAARAGEELLASHVGNSAAAHAELGDIRRRLGDLDAAEEAFARAEALCGSSCGEVALLRLAQGRTDAAMALVTECVRGASHRLARTRVLPIYVQVAVAAGDLDAAEEALVELDDIAAAAGTPMLRAVVRSMRGRVALARRAPEVAEAELRAALEIWRSLDVPYEVATTHTLLGQAQRARGDDAGAKASFAAAVALFDQLGARFDARQVGVEARPPLPAGLTEREVEVLRLIAAGMTNGEIAATLYLSVKTVSRHLSNIFTKIGVSSRTAATAFAFEHDLVDGRRPG